VFRWAAAELGEQRGSIDWKYSLDDRFGAGRAQAALYVRRDVAVDPDRRAAGGPSDAGRHLPRDQNPVIAVVWQYTGLPPDQMSGRVMLNFQRALTTTVNDIEHIEGTSYTGVGIVKIFFQPGTSTSASPTHRSPPSRRPC
jgi:hypothetical protein